jgi:signal transduction histidine kinase
MRSIRSSLLIGTVLGSIGVLVVAGFVLQQSVRSILVEQFDGSLNEKARFLAASIEEVDGEVEVDFEDLDMREFESDGGGYLQIWLADGRELYRSVSLGSDKLARVQPHIDERTFDWVASISGVELRGMTMRFHPYVDVDDSDNMQSRAVDDPADAPVAVDDPGDGAPGNEQSGDSGTDGDTGYKRDPQAQETDGPAGKERPLSDYEVIIAMAREPASINLFMARLRAALITIGLLTGLAAVIVLSIVIHRSLQPLDRLAHRIADHGPADVFARIHVPTAPRELSPVISQLNSLLERLETAIHRERTFSADVAHELRTPLSGLKSTIEVALSRPRNAADYREALTESFEIVLAAQKIIHTLLYIHRLDSSNFKAEKTHVDLTELAGISWNSLSRVAEQRNIDVQWQLQPGLFVTTDPVLLGAAIQNLLDNAVSYANEGGYVCIESAAADGWARLKICNSGSEVSQEQVLELTERFTRAHGLRDPSGSHTGLGLAIVSRITKILDIGMTIRSQPGGDFEVVLSVEHAKGA